MRRRDAAGRVHLQAQSWVETYVLLLSVCHCLARDVRYGHHEFLQRSYILTATSDRWCHLEGSCFVEPKLRNKPHDCAEAEKRRAYDGVIVIGSNACSLTCTKVRLRGRRQ